MSPTEPATGHGREMPSRPATTFDWNRPKGRPFWLMVFVLFSVVGHAVCFYLFRVVYPPQKRELLKPMTITVLNPSDPMTAGVLSRIDDRVVSFDSRIVLDLRGEPAEGSPESEVLRRELFVPFYKDYEPQLQKLPLLGDEESFRLFPAGKVFLPLPSNVSLRQPAAAEKFVPNVPVLSIQWERAERKIVKAFLWPDQDNTPRPADVFHSHIHVGVDRSGRVVHALPESGAGPEMDAGILKGIRGMRFEAVGAGSVDWALFVVRW